ncbi:MAG: GHKL domain-containing protein, partial [Eubacteriales bacterium]
MNNLRILIDVFGAGIETIIIYTFFSAVAGTCKVTKKNLFLSYFLLFILAAIFVLTLNNPIALAGAMLATTLAVSCLYKSNLFIKIFISTAIIVLIILSEIFTGVIIAAITKDSVEVITSNIFYYIEGVLISKTLLLILAKAIQYKKLPSGSKISKALYIPIFAMPFSTMLIIYVISEYAYSLVKVKSVTFVAIAVMLLVLSNMLVFYLFEKQLRQDEETKKSMLVQQQLRYQSQYFKELSDKYKLSNKTIHDTKNQLFAISAAINDKNIDMAKSKIDELCKNADVGQNSIKTGNDALDALINTKYNDNKELNINFKHNIIFNSTNKIDNIDLCIIIGNALDNAIEACLKIDRNKEKEITLKIRQVNNFLAVEMTNPTSENIEKVNG